MSNGRAASRADQVSPCHLSLYPNPSRGAFSSLGRVIDRLERRPIRFQLFPSLRSVLKEEFAGCVIRSVKPGGEYRNRRGTVRHAEVANRDECDLLIVEYDGTRIRNGLPN